MAIVNKFKLEIYFEFLLMYTYIRDNNVTETDSSNNIS